MKKETPTQIKLDELHAERLRHLSKANKYGLKLARLANLAIEKGLPILVKEFGKPITNNK
jgi:hypothetical protein